MSLDMVQACIDGYKDSILDSQIIAVQTGYWAAYYANSKHPRSVHSVAESMMKKQQQSHHKTTKTNAPRPDVDVEAFLAREARFQAKRRKQQGR